MSNDDWDDYDTELDDEAMGDEQTGAEDVAPCPECGVEIFVDAEQCPSCGYWPSTAERHSMWSGGSQTGGLRRVGKIVLVVVLIALLSGLVCRVF